MMRMSFLILVAIQQRRWDLEKWRGTFLWAYLAR